jgi:Glycosyl transferase family 2
VPGTKVTGVGGTAVVASEDGIERAVARALRTSETTIVGPPRLEPHIPHHISFVPVADLDVEITPPYLTSSYACYATLREQPFRTAVFPDRGATAYCAARARETGTALAATEVLVECREPTLRSLLLAPTPYISKGMLGLATAERLALELADGYVSEDASLVDWLLRNGWRLPSERERAWANVSPSQQQLPPPSTPLVSVVIPHRDRTHYLPWCLDGLARQAYSPLEVIIADDGSSSEAARAQLDDLEGRSWPWPLRVLRLSSGGPHAARNAGWRDAHGDFIAFFDDDDVPFDAMIATLWQARENSGADVAVGGARYFHGDSAPVARRGDVVRVSLCDPRELGLLSNQYGGPVALWPRALLEQLGGFTSRQVDDWHLLARATLHGARMTAPPDPVYWYRQTPGSRYSGDPVAYRHEGIPQLAEAFAERLPQDLRLLPLLVAGAYAEIERRAQSGRSRRSVMRTRAQLLLRRARVVRDEEGSAAAARQALRSLARRVAG